MPIYQYSVIFSNHTLLLIMRFNRLAFSVLFTTTTLIAIIWSAIDSCTIILTFGAIVHWQQLSSKFSIDFSIVRKNMPRLNAQY